MDFSKKFFKNLNQIFELKKIFQKIFLIKIFLKFQISLAPPPLSFFFAKDFKTILKDFDRRDTSKHLTGVKKTYVPLFRRITLNTITRYHPGKKDTCFIYVPMCPPHFRRPLVSQH